jgi:hypothetical protein
VPNAAAGDANLEAGRLAAAMLRFQEPLAHLMSASTPHGMPIIGVDAYAFLPSSRRVLRQDVAAWLAALPSAAFIATTTTRGILALVLLDELSGERRASLQKELDNQHTGLLELAEGPDTDRVLLEFDEETSLYSLPGVRRWAERFCLTVGWSIEPCPEPDRAEWRLNLLGGDGRRRSKGFGPS